MTRALVTGAPGFLGSHVAVHLRDAGYEVRGLVRPGGAPASALPEGIEPVPGDVRDPDAMRRAAEGTDVIFHVAAVYALGRRQAARVRSVNVGGTAVAIGAARQAGARLVHTSSVATVGIPGDGTHGDEETHQPISQVIGAYKQSKVEAESLVRRAAATGLEAYVVNPSAPIGPGDRRPTPTGRLITDALTGRLPRKRLLLALMALFTAGNLLAWLAPTYESLVAARILTGLAHGVFFSIGSTIANCFLASLPR